MSKWTKEPPKESGYYFAKPWRAKTPEILLVDGVYVYSHGTHLCMDITQMTGWLWYNKPIERPR